MGGLLRPSQHANPAHFIVPNTLSRVRTARITCSVFDRRIPSSAFVNVGDGVFVASPELCLLLEARTAAFASLVETGYELCGSYRLAASSDAGMMSDQLPLTSTSKLQSFLSRARNLNGVDTARKAVPHILPNSESPKESQLSILSSFPGRLGGYGFPQPTLNHPVRISEKARGRNVGGTCRCDLFWPDAKLDVEYDSRLHHAGEAATSCTRGRRWTRSPTRWRNGWERDAARGRTTGNSSRSGCDHSCSAPRDWKCWTQKRHP